MHPLSIFPQLFFLELIAPLLLRLSVGLFVIYLGKERVQKTYNWSAIIYIISGILLVLGFYTQIAVIVAILIIGFDFFTEKKIASISKEKRMLYIMVGVILLSLLFTGPGFLAFDLPL
ncbi:MAG: hypothetical protein NTX96_02485 [Candidatus Zambryskibacteria bacterium]|nr:hypothetical protein [Candidatus Zambryskibacteria bacterium]